jgi:HEAT repeat protein
MGLREDVMRLLRTADAEGLQALVVRDRRALRPLLARLWDTDEAIRRRAAAAVGTAAEAHPDLGLEAIRRLVWGLNDEAATNGVYGIAALGEIGARRPDLVAPFVGALVSLSWDEGLRAELWMALERVAGAAPGLVAPYADELAGYRAGVSREEAILLDRLLKRLSGGTT